MWQIKKWGSIDRIRWFLSYKLLNFHSLFHTHIQKMRHLCLMLWLLLHVMGQRTRNAASWFHFVSSGLILSGIALCSLYICSWWRHIVMLRTEIASHGCCGPSTCVALLPSALWSIPSCYPQMAALSLLTGCTFTTCLNPAVTFLLVLLYARILSHLYSMQTSILTILYISFTNLYIEASAWRMEGKELKWNTL